MILYLKPFTHHCLKAVSELDVHHYIRAGSKEGFGFRAEDLSHLVRKGEGHHTMPKWSENARLIYLASSTTNSPQ